ncbi:MAG: diaminopimelate dehydrogenase [Oscillospiraceae bacterium]|nr:diaminopimelate dehydrogenase [Oscillospiraceae bacterium]
MKKIKVGIVGYGNVGKGAEKVLHHTDDMELVGVFTRRAPNTLTLADPKVPVYSVDDAPSLTDRIDVMLLCGGSATDLQEQAPHFASMFNLVCSYDNHLKIPEYLASVDAAAKDTSAIISAGWDPGLFSMVKLLSESILPNGKTYTFWGPGLSQGHSDALRRIVGVKNAVQYTLPIDKAIEAVRSGALPDFTTREKHLRECFVVLEPGADPVEVERQIKSMPNYFADYDTAVHFIDENELMQNHAHMPHGGTVLHSGKTTDHEHVIEFALKLESNPEFTASIMVACARACHRLFENGTFGAKTVFDIPLAYLSPKSHAALVKELL